MLDIARLRRAVLLRHVEHHAELGSTNDRAAQITRDAAIELPALVLADRQTAGRGRGANRWWSAPGALTFSLVIDAAGRSIAAERLPLVSLASGLAVCEALESFAPDASLAVKWPNDVYTGDRKLCGILVEAPATPAGRLVIGVGVNVNNSFDAASADVFGNSPDDAPVEVLRRATSLREASGTPHNLTDVLAAVLLRLDESLTELGGTSSPFALSSPLAERWRRCLLTGRVVQVDTLTESIVGQCEGIGDDGALLLRTSAGLRRCVAGAVARWSA